MSFVTPCRIAGNAPHVTHRATSISVTLLSELNKTEKTQENTAIRDNFLYYRVKTGISTNGGFVLARSRSSQRRAVP